MSDVRIVERGNVDESARVREAGEIGVFLSGEVAG